MPHDPDYETKDAVADNLVAFFKKHFPIPGKGIPVAVGVTSSDVRLAKVVQHLCEDRASWGLCEPPDVTALGKGLFLWVQDPGAHRHSYVLETGQMVALISILLSYWR